MPINRIAYFAQSGTVRAGTGTGNNVYMLPISSANIEVSRPVEPVTAFGQFGALAVAQSNLTTCKASLKGYLGTGVGINGLSATAINDLITETQAQASGGIVITVNPNGFAMTGILTNLGIDISAGGFGTFDMGFAGIGNPYVVTGGTSATAAYTTLTVTPATMHSVNVGTGLLSGTSVTSIKFSYDLPTDTLSALGDNPNANQGNLNSVIATKAPYKSSLSLEGYGLDVTMLDSLVTGVVQVGNIIFQMPKAKVNSRSMSNAAGQVAATFSLATEDVSATFTAGNVSGYQQTGVGYSTYGPAWGA